MTEQQGWRLCRKCLSSCYGGLPGLCATGGQHDFQGSGWYAIPYAAPADVSSQDGWRWCKKCQVLFHPGEGAGVCPAGGGHENPPGNPYVLASSPYPWGGEEGWRYCQKCHVMHRPGAGPGTCPAGGAHLDTPSIPYSMRLGVPQGCSIPSAQPGWRRCRKCHSSCFGGIPGACAAGGIHDLLGSAWYGMPTEAPSGGNSQDGWRYCRKCQVLFHPGEGAGLCASGGGHEQDPTGCSYRLAFSPYAADGQEGWRYCDSCHALHLRDGSEGACPAGGEHTDASSLPYSMLLQIPMASVLRPSQPGWRRCRKCQASCFGGIPGVCASGGRHDFGDSAWYCLPTEPPYGVNSQDGWRYCRKCQVLFHPGEGAGVCPSGGGHEQDPAGCNYPLALAPYPTDGQQGWRYCGKCHVMHLPGASPGTCAAGGVHTDTPSLPYSMLRGAPIRQPVQTGWRRCRKCRASCYAGLAGICTAGEQHDFEGSAWYSLATTAPADGNHQDGWRWCKKCQVLFHAGLGVGVCPAGGGHENPPGSPYHLAIAPYASCGQEGWRYCDRCHALHLADTSPGPCPAGGEHTVTTSLPYSLRLQNQIEVQCKLITDHDADQQPQSRFEVVLIPRGVDGSLLPGTEIKVLASSPVNIIREEKGVITTQGLDSGTPLSFTTSAMGRVRFTLVPPQDRLALPNLFAQSVAMGADQWAEFSADDELHTRLAGLTGDQLTTAPAGRSCGPLLPTSRAADAAALATSVSRVMTRFNPQAATGRSVVSFAWWDDIADGAESGLGVIAGGFGSVIDAATAAANKATEVANSLYDTIASQTSVAVSAPSRFLDTVGSAAQLLIQNASSALANPVEPFIANAIPAATQLAIDVAGEVTVIALVVVDGVRSLVKTVVQNVEAAAAIAAAFFKRVGLTIKAVIEFLASMLDWVSILRLQAQLQQVWDDQMDAMPATLAALRSSLANQLQALQAQLSSLGASGGGAPAAGLGLVDLTSLGGGFGFLLDKLLSNLGQELGASFDLGLGSLPVPALPPAAELDALVSSVVSSSLFGALQAPGQLLSDGPRAMLDPVLSLAQQTIGLVGTLADGVLASAPEVMGAVRQLFQQRIAIPILTDFIELVVFRGKQELSLGSLLTLFAAALLHVLLRAGGIIGRALSFADTETPILPMTVLRACLSLLGLCFRSNAKNPDTLTQEEEEEAQWVAEQYGPGGVNLPTKISLVCDMAGTVLWAGSCILGTSGSVYFDERCLVVSLYTVAECLRARALYRGVPENKGARLLLGLCMTMASAGWHIALFERNAGSRALAMADLAYNSLTGFYLMSTYLPASSRMRVITSLGLASLGVLGWEMSFKILNPQAQLGKD